MYFGTLLDRPWPSTGQAALWERRHRIRALAARYLAYPMAFERALDDLGIPPTPRGDLPRRLRRIIRAHQAAGTLGPWWTERHQGLHALALAATLSRVVRTERTPDPTEGDVGSGANGWDAEGT
jgi:hypothetical protein